MLRGRTRHTVLQNDGTAAAKLPRMIATLAFWVNLLTGVQGDDVMRVTAMKFPKRLGAAAVLVLAGLSLAGCVVYPSSYGYGGGYYAPAVVAPPVYGSIFIGGGWRR
jgi:hypothetical protein